MKLHKNIIIVCFSLFTWASCFSQNTEDLKAINSQIWSNFSKAYELLDSELFASLHHEDFIRISGDSKKIKNKGIYIEGYQNRWTNSDRKQTIDFRFLERFTNGNTASERGIYKLTINPNTDSEKSYYGKFHVVLTKTNGLWLILIDYDSSEKNTINAESYSSAFDKEDFEKY